MKNNKGFIYKILFIITVISVSCSFAGFAARYVNPFNSIIFEWAALSLNIVILLNLILTFCWIIYRKWFLVLLTLFAVIINIRYITSVYGFNSPEKHGESMLSIMSYNVKMFGGKADFYKAKRIAQAADAEGIDILCLQEYDSGKDNQLNSCFESLPYAVSYSENSILSKYPVREWKAIPFGDSPKSLIYADIDVRGEMIRVINTHLETTGFSATKNNYDKYGYISLSGFLKSFNRAIRIRFMQSSEVGRLIDTSSIPVILCCDINDIPASHSYKVISKGLRDSFRDFGRGYGYTYMGMKKMLRIDYIFYSKSIKGKDFRSPDIYLSDHRAIILEADL